MNIAIGCDHRGAKFAKMLTYNLLMPNHYTVQAEFIDPEEEEVAGAFMIENSAIAPSFDEEAAKDARIYPIQYSLASQDHTTAPEVGDVLYVDYPDVAAAVAEAVSTGAADRGILICGTGIGMCIVANKFEGVRAACSCNEVAATLSRRHNDANVLCLSGDFLSENAVEAIVRAWIAAPFEGGRHQRRVDMISEIERKTGL